MTGSVTTTALCVLLATAAPLAVAAGLRCDDDLVSRGMTPVEVFERCGTPEFEQAWTDYRYPGRFVRVAEWSYNLGDNRFRRLLTFENGRLTRIETRDKPAGGLPAAVVQ
jgi:hypothetical protein